MVAPMTRVQYAQPTTMECPQQGERNQPQTLQTMKEEIAEKSSSTEEDAVHSLCDKDDLYTPIPELRPRPCDRKMKKPIHEPR